MNSKKSFWILNEAGMTLIELLISFGIAGILTMTVISTLDHQRKQIKGMYQKSEALDFKTNLNQQMSKPDVCSWQFAGKSISISPLPSLNTPSSTTLSITTLYQGLNNTSPVLAQVGEKLPGTNNDLDIGSIQFHTIYATGNPNEYVGTLEVQFDSSKLAAPIKPIQIQKYFNATPSGGGMASISKCSGGSGASKAPIHGTFCDTYSSCPNGQCFIAGSEDAMGCFLTAVDDDTARLAFDGLGSLKGSSNSRWNRVDVDLDSGMQPKCELQPVPGGGWYYRASMDCELVACQYTCIFPP